MGLWFAEKFVSLLIEQHRTCLTIPSHLRCDLLKNSYLCLLNNTRCSSEECFIFVVICWKIRIFAYWTTPAIKAIATRNQLWFAEKFVSLLIEQHRRCSEQMPMTRCDLLKNSYLCLLNNTRVAIINHEWRVVICWKIRIFAYWTTPSRNRRTEQSMLWFAEKFVSLLIEQHPKFIEFMFKACCDLLKNSYLCLLNNTFLDIRFRKDRLWFAEKFVSLLIEQHLAICIPSIRCCCDLLKNSYLCLLNNTI